MKSFGKVLLLAMILAGVTWGAVRAVEDREQKEVDAAAAKAAAPGGGAPRAPLAAEGITIAYEPFETRISAVGSLAPKESVDIAAEAQRRLVKILINEGQHVTEGDPLFELDASDLNAELKQLEARQELAEVRLKRLADAFGAGAATAAELDTIKTEVRVIEAEMESVRVNVDKTIIRAPFTGKVGIRRVSVGTIVSPNMTLITLQDRSQLKIDFKVPERFSASVRIGQRFRFRPDGVADWFEGTVAAIEPTIERETRSLVVRGIAENPDERMIPGAFVAVELVAESLTGAVLIPSEAVIPSPNGSTVFVAENGKALVRPIEVGERTAGRVHVLSGLKEGEVVLTTNLLRMRPGAVVAVTASVVDTTMGVVE